MIKGEEVVVAWVPNRESFSAYQQRGNVIVFVPPETIETQSFTHTVGANTSGWKEAGVSGRQQRMQRVVTEMIHDDKIRLEVIQAALCQVDEWQRFPFSVARPPAKDD